MLPRIPTAAFLSLVVLSASQDKVTRGGKPPAASDTLLMAYGNDPDTVNLITSNDTTSGSFQRWVYETLADRKLSNPDEWEPVLAEKWEFDEKNLEYTIHLRKGIRWHPMSLPDGTALPETELTSADVKFTFDCILNKHVDAASLRSYFEDPDAKTEEEKIKIAWEVVDPYTLKCKWTKPYFQSDEFTLGLGIIPEHVYSVNEKGEPISFDYSSKEFADGFNRHWANDKMCGTGPLIFKDWRKGERVVLERNPAYWSDPFPFSKVVFKNIPNPNTSLQLTLQNELDTSGIGEKDLYVQSKDHANVKEGKVVLAEYDYPVYRYLGYNQKRELFKDKRVRWAIGHAVPIDDIIEKIYYGLARRLTGPFLPGSSSYNTSLAPLKHDLERSKTLLDEAGWKDSDGDGIRDKSINGIQVDARFDLMIYADSPQYTTIAQVIKENCRKIGVEVLISPAKWALMLQKLRKKEFDATILGWALGWKQDPFQIFHGSQAEVPDSSNSIGYQNPELDKLIEELRITFNPERQVKLYHEIHRIIYEDQPYTFLLADKLTAAFHSRIQNIKFYQPRPCLDQREWFTTAPRILD